MAVDINLNNVAEKDVQDARFANQNTINDSKVDKEAGKGLSDENYTSAEKSKLASITAIFTTALKNAYDSSVNWIATNGAILINHLSSNSNPHGVTKTQVGLGNVSNTDTTTTANITDSTNKRFLTDSQLSNIGNQSGTNTGDNATNSQYSGLAASKQDKPISGEFAVVKDNKSIDFLGVLTEPAAPTAGTLSVYSKSVNGRMSLKVKGASGLDTPLQNALYQNTIWLVSPNTTTSVSAIGGAVTSVGTISTISPTTTSYGVCTNFATTAVANSTSGTGSTLLPLNLSSTAAGNGGFTFVSRLWFPDANYGSDITGSRVFIGATNQTMAVSVGSDNPAGYRIGFGLSTVLLETEFMLTTKNNVTETRVSTGVSFLSNKLYDFYITVFPGGTTVYWRIDNLTDGTSNEGTTNATLPPTTIYMRSGFQLATLTTLIRNIRMKKIYVETDN